MRFDKSMLDEAYDVLVHDKKTLTFNELVDEVSKNLEMNDDEKKGHLGGFYTELSLDGRFVALTDNTWDLRARHTYAKVHIDVNDVYSDVEEGDEDIEDQEEEKEYNAQVEGKPVPEGDDVSEEEDTDPEKKMADADIVKDLGINKKEDY